MNDPEANAVEHLYKYSRSWMHDISAVIALLDLQASLQEQYMPGIIEQYRSLNDQLPRGERIPKDVLKSFAQHADQLHRLADRLRKGCNSTWETLAAVRDEPTLLQNRCRLRNEPEDWSLVNAARKAAREETPQPAAEATANRPLALVADDELLMREVLGDLIEDCGYRVEKAEHGGQAWEMIQRNQYELVFLDFRMPVMHGFEVAEKVRSYKQGSRPRLIGITNTPDRDEHDKGLSLGLDEVLVKPVLKGALDAVLARAANH